VTPRPVSTAADTDPAAVLRSMPGENFPVAPVILPAAIRRHLMALYGFARLVDDLGDEAGGDRGALLDELEDDLRLVWAGRPVLPVNIALVATVRDCDLPAEPFHRLVAANRQDQVVTRYATYADLVRYCTLSADPVGRLVLGVFGQATPDRVALSDQVCTALQLAEHWQDVAEDLAAGRIYLPTEDLAAHGVTEADLAAPVGNPAVRRLMAFEVARARALLDAGTPLVGMVRGRLRLALAGFVGGGRAALDAVRRAGYDPLPGTPKASKASLLRHVAAVAVRPGTAARPGGAVGA
jgi:squalene synthase HpnC